MDNRTNCLITLCIVLLCSQLGACGRASNDASEPESAPVQLEPSMQAMPQAIPEVEPIDLSMELLDDIIDEDDHVAERKDGLPDMFESTPAERTTRIKGGLLITDEPVDMRDIVEGVEVKIEIPTG
jgi:hypothetical protein